MLKRMLAALVLICLIPVLAVAQEASVVVNLIANPEAEWTFEERRFWRSFSRPYAVRTAASFALGKKP